MVYNYIPYIYLKVKLLNLFKYSNSKSKYLEMETQNGIKKRKFKHFQIL